MSLRLYLFGALLLVGCADEQNTLDVCDRAAEHRAECVGEYVTPPICDEEAQASADYLQSLHFTALVNEDDDAGRETIAAMAAAARRGVEVRVIVDATTQYDFSSYAVLKPLVDAGGQVLPYNPVLEWASERYRNGLNVNQ